jgi:carbamoyltransferase
LLFTEHHLAHAASAFFPSPFAQAGVLCLDGVGEWATTSVWRGEGHDLEPLWQIDFPHSLGLLYSAFTYYLGFKVNSGEYKVMGLAPYGEPKYVDLIYRHLLDLKPDGSFRLNQDYFNYCTGLTMTSTAFDRLFGAPPRQPESRLTQREMDLARSIQVVCEEVVLRLARTVKRESGLPNLCLAGGVALNCVANGRVLRECGFDGLWIQPAAGDAGGALGAALAAWHQYLGQPRQVQSGQDQMRGAFLGPAFTPEQTRQYLESAKARYEELPDAALFERLSQLLEEGKVIGWCRGRMEFGPRALGTRSIIGDARNTQMQSVMNLKIKYRESFRPFAPAVLDREVANYFEMNEPSPYMLLVAPVREALRRPMTAAEETLFGIDKLHLKRSEVPAITHVDYSARVQTVHRETNPDFYALLEAFQRRTGCAVIVNTSFNVRGEPIVCSPEDAYRCFMRTEMDYLVLGNYLLAKQDQTPWPKDESWKSEFGLD